MNTDKCISVIRDKLGFQCKYDKKLNQLSIQIKQTNTLIFKPEIIGSIDKSNIGAVIHHMKNLEKSLLLTNHINKILAEQLQKADIQYIDCSGNVYINERSVFISVKGESPNKLTLGNEQTFMLSVASIKIIFTLLVVKNAIELTYRDIAKMSDVALGSVNKTFILLEKHGYLLLKKDGKRRLVNTENLLSKWCIGYTERLRPKLIIGKFSSEHLELLKEINPVDYGFLWGGEIAAAKLSNHLKSQLISLYAEDEIPRLQLKYRLKRDIDGNIELLKKFWNFDTDVHKQNVVPFILVYADLLSSFDERNQEIAEIIYDKYIKKQME